MYVAQGFPNHGSQADIGWALNSQLVHVMEPRVGEYFLTTETKEFQYYQYFAAFL